MKFHQVNKEGERKVIPRKGDSFVKAWECEPAEGLWELSMVCGEEGQGAGEDRPGKVIGTKL